MSINIAILGATGLVGQKVIALLQNNPWFKIAELAASTVDKTYEEACNWREPLCTLPEDISSITLKRAEDVKSDFIISCLPSEVAKGIDSFLASKGKIIFSNASAFRMHHNIPLIIPEINASHLSLLKNQNTEGKIITNPNCSAVGVALALAPLINIGKIEDVSIVTMQSISGAGYPGVPSIDLIGNTIPHIDGEVDKINEEIKRILGTPTKHADFNVLTHVHRVPVLYGHTITIHVRFSSEIKQNNVIDSYASWNSKFNNLFVIHTKEGRPQVGLDLTHNDMRVHIGHINTNKNLLGLVCLTHNLVRGAAGAVIANMSTYFTNLSSS